MSQFDAAVSRVLEHLKRDPALDGIRFVSGYPAYPRSSPVKRPTAAVALQGVHLHCGGLGGYLGRSEQQEINGNRAELSVSIRIYAPLPLGGEGCADAFSRICASLMLGGPGGVLSVDGGALCYDPDASAFRMECTVKLRLYWGMDAGGQPVERVTVKGAAT